MFLSANSIKDRRYVAVFILAGFILTSISLMSTFSPIEHSYGREELSTEDENVRRSNDTSDDSTVIFKSNLEQIAGHLNAALLNKEKGNDTLALAHAFHPIAEIFTLIEPTIASVNSTLNMTLGEDLTNLTDTVGFASAGEFSNAVQNAKELLNETSDAIIPPELDDNLAFNAKVIIDLLNTAEAEYGEAVANDTITEIVEYQDAQAFISRGIERAESIFHQELASIPQNMSESVQEVQTMFTDLDSKILSVSSPESVGSTIQGIVSKLSEIAGISETIAEGDSPAQLISNIRDLLNQVVIEYGNQNYSQAESLATEAYLENYEYVEDPLAEIDESLMLNTEVMMREELRQLIQDRVPLEQLQQHIDMINNNLNEAEQLLVGNTS